MARLASYQFMQALPAAVRAHLPPELRKFKTLTRSWLCQLYYRRPQLHYEVWNQGEHRGQVEIGLHFESRDPAENARLLHGFERHLIEVKARLGERWEAEQWTKSWTKVYAVVKYEPFTETYLEDIAARLAEAMVVLHPMFEDIYKSKP